MKKILLGAAALGSVALPIATVLACGSTSSKEIAFTDIKKVYGATDGGRRDDNSFNQQTRDAITELTTNEKQFLDSKSSSAGDILAAYNTAIDSGAEVILGSGFLHQEVLAENATKGDYKGIAFVLLDGELKADNVASILFKSEQGGFLAGYEAAKYSSSLGASSHHKVATFGGLNIPSVTSYMEGYKAGIDFFNAEDADASNDVQLVATGDAFVGNFDADKDNAVTTRVTNLIKSNQADVIFPVGGAQQFTAVDTVEKLGSEAGNVKVVGVDSDLHEVVTGELKKSMVLGSVLKGVKNALVDVTKALYNVEGRNKLPNNDATGKAVLNHTFTGDLSNKWISFTNNAHGATAPSDKLLKAAEEFKIPSTPTFK